MTHKYFKIFKNLHLQVRNIKICFNLCNGHSFEINIVYNSYGSIMHESLIHLGKEMLSITMQCR